MTGSRLRCPWTKSEKKEPTVESGEQTDVYCSDREEYMNTDWERGQVQMQVRSIERGAWSVPKMEHMRSDFQVRREFGNSQIIIFGFDFDVVSEGNCVNLDFEELKRVTLSEECKWFDMLHSVQQSWSKGKEQTSGG